MAPAAWAAALESSALGEWMRSAGLAYPIVNVIHLFGLTLLVGPMLLLDLRLLGVAQHFPLPAVSELLTRCAVAGLVLLIGTGFLLFSADAGPLSQSPVFIAKLIVIGSALVNALLFRALWQQRLARWDSDTPATGRAQALFSIAAWLTAGTLGRWIAYA